MEARETCPQIEAACGQVTALVLRHLEPLSASDLLLLRELRQRHSVDGQVIQWWLQPRGPDTVHLLDTEPEPVPLSYALPGLRHRASLQTDRLHPGQSAHQPRAGRARLLAVEQHERVIDWFCGLGNFTLPLATQAREVLGIEAARRWWRARARIWHTTSKAAAAWRRPASSRATCSR